MIAYNDLYINIKMKNPFNSTNKHHNISFIKKKRREKEDDMLVKNNPFSNGTFIFFVYDGRKQTSHPFHILMLYFF